MEFPAENVYKILTEEIEETEEIEDEDETDKEEDNKKNKTEDNCACNNCSLFCLSLSILFGGNR